MYCEKCGKFVSNNTEFCPYCLTELNTKKVSGGSIIKLALAILNLTTFVPGVAKFAAVWFFLGQLGDNRLTFLLILGGCLLYVVGTGLLSLKVIFEFIRNNEKAGKILKIAVIGYLIFGGGVFCINKFAPDLFADKGEVVEVSKSSLYNSDDVKITVEDVRYFENGKGTLNEAINIRFKLENNSKKYYNFCLENLTINDELSVHFFEGNDSGFDDDENGNPRWVKPNSESDNYEISIIHSVLDKLDLDINDIKKMTFKATLRSNKDGSSEYDETKIKEPIIIEVN